jgi:hypothetical protein
MKSLKFVSIALALGFSIQLGCGSDNGTKTTDGPPIINGGTGGTFGPEAGMTSTGGSGIDATIATGGTGGSVHMDGGGVDSAMSDAPMGGAGGSAVDSGPSEAGSVIDICAGLTAQDCQTKKLAIHTAIITAEDPTVMAQDVPNTNPPDYRICSQ